MIKGPGVGVGLGLVQIKRGGEDFWWFARVFFLKAVCESWPRGFWTTGKRRLEKAAVFLLITYTKGPRFHALPRALVLYMGPTVFFFLRLPCSRLPVLPDWACPDRNNLARQKLMNAHNLDLPPLENGQPKLENGCGAWMGGWPKRMATSLDGK